MAKRSRVGVRTSCSRARGACTTGFRSAIDGKQGSVYEGKPKEGTTAQVTITVDDNDFIDLASGKANAPAVGEATLSSSCRSMRVLCSLAVRQGQAQSERQRDAGAETVDTLQGTIEIINCDSFLTAPCVCLFDRTTCLCLIKTMPFEAQMLDASWERERQRKVNRSPCRTRGCE